MDVKKYIVLPIQSTTKMREQSPALQDTIELNPSTQSLAFVIISECFQEESQPGQSRCFFVSKRVKLQYVDFTDDLQMNDAGVTHTVLRRGLIRLINENMWRLAVKGL